MAQAKDFCGQVEAMRMRIIAAHGEHCRRKAALEADLLWYQMKLAHDGARRLLSEENSTFLREYAASEIERYSEMMAELDGTQTRIAFCRRHVQQDGCAA